MSEFGFETVGSIARRLGVPTHVVERIVITRKIAHAGRAGVLRLFDRAAVEQIAAVLRSRKKASVDRVTTERVVAALKGGNDATQQ